jgi:lipopolysaccharide exporter
VIPLKTNSFIHNLRVLLTGTVAAQGLLVLISPILSRLYTPNQFGELSIYTSIFMILTVIATLRYEQAIIIAKTEEEALVVLKSCLVISLALSTIISLLLYFYKTPFLRLLGISSDTNWIWLVPVSTLALGFYQSLNYWCTRNGEYKRLSKSLIFRSSTMSLVQTGSGIAKLNHFNGLIIGQVMGQLISSISLFIQVLLKDKKKFINNKLTLSNVKETLISFREFPLFSIPTGIIDTFSRNMIPFFFIAYYGAGIAGFFAMAAKMIQIPFDLIGNSIFQVFYPKITSDFNNGKGIYSSTRKILIYMSLFSFTVIIIVLLCGPWLFKLVLGDQWVIAGEYARWVVITFTASFVTKPIIAVIRLFKLQHWHLAFEGILLSVRCIILIVGGNFYTPIKTLQLYSLTSLIFYSILIILILIRTKKTEKINSN